MKQTRVLSEIGFILHARPYRETSLLLEVFTKNHGRVSLVARGVRKKQALQSFTNYDFSWSGRSELYGLMRAENVGACYLFSPYQLCCGLYINELLLRVLQKEDAHPELYFAYEELLIDLVGCHPEEAEVFFEADVGIFSNRRLPRPPRFARRPRNDNKYGCEIALRVFEKKLLQALGYGFSFENIFAEHYYQFRASEGLIPIHEKTPESISGESLLAFENDGLEERHLNEIKKLMRMALSPLVGDKPLRSRELFL